MSDIREEEALGKIYDSRLTRRLLQYLRPYKWWVFFALLLTLAVAPLEIVGPYFFKIAVDSYITPVLQPQARLRAVACAHLGWITLGFLAALHPELRFAIRSNARDAARRPGNHVRPAPRNLHASAAAADELLRPQPGRPAGDARNDGCGCAQRSLRFRRCGDAQRLLRAAVSSSRCSSISTRSLRWPRSRRCR